MYDDLIGSTIDKTDSRFADFPKSIDGEIYLSGSPETGWETQILITLNQETITQAIQDHIDKQAQALGYDNINTIAKFMGFDNDDRVNAEALAVWCANVWKFAKEEFAKVEAQTRTLPDTMEEIVAELPRY